MKKSVIKRRKRVVPAAQATAIDVANNAMGSPELDDNQSAPRTSAELAVEQRGSVNLDGSINLGFRPKLPRQILPEPNIRSSNGHSQNDLTSYSSQHNHHDLLQSHSRDDENRLPPMAGYPNHGVQRVPSLSPSSFPSPNHRKRSFSIADVEGSGGNDSKRLSSIKSILNPASGQHTSDDEMLDPTLRAQNISNPRNNTGQISVAESSSHDGIEARKLERRRELQREAERMREALKAKERELEELND